MSTVRASMQRQGGVRHAPSAVVPRGNVARMTRPHWHSGRGPFRADQVRSGDPYELSRGHPIVCAPTGYEGSEAIRLGATVLGSDPAVTRVGVDTGIALGPDTLRAPDVAVNYTPGDGTWATAVPLAVEYAGEGQDEADLRDKIAELHAAGTRWVWVVRLVGERRVEVHENGALVRVVGADGVLEAPGVLALSVPVRALFERDAAHETTLRNLLAAKGVPSLDAGRKEGLDAGRKEGLDAGLLASRRDVLRMLLEAAGVVVTADDEARVAACADLAALDAWILRARVARSRGEVFDDARA